MKVTLEFAQGDPKKHSVRYEHTDEGEGYSMSVYVPRKLLEELGYPKEMKITLEAATE